MYFFKLEKLYFPYKADNKGRCEMLTDDNKCSVYEGRPLICNIDKLQPIMGIPKKQYYAMNVAACNTMMDGDGLPLKYRIGIHVPNNKNSPSLTEALNQLDEIEMNYFMNNRKEAEQ